MGTRHLHEHQPGKPAGREIGARAAGREFTQRLDTLFAAGLDERGGAGRGGGDPRLLPAPGHPGTIVDNDLKKYLAEEDLKAARVLDTDGRAVLDPERQLKTVEQGAPTGV
ncbi:hypothetical protein ACFVTC_03880 [Streptomyces sp. NPDC057950]|uniref:hypothetical protein n=1 Tax=Streptomyces sp. NPDC057950 TaxID=3346288 RepID=UPI0036E9A154